MADGDSDIPPLEDMTDVLKQANAIREQLDRPNEGKHTQKQKAKVNKKHPTARAVPSTEVKVDPPVAPENQNIRVTNNDNHDNPSHPKREAAIALAKPSKEAPSLFGGMKKGFLFGSSNKSTSVSSNKSSSSSSSSKSPSSSKPDGKDEKRTSNKETSDEKSKVEEIPFITPKQKTESGLTLNEVQQAMGEAKGLMDNQDWVTDDLLNKIEKNDYLIKRFSDPRFMTALQEFQTNAETAMAKYKGDSEVEKFLTEFCGLLGDHFTNLSGSEGNQTKSSPSPKKTMPKVQPVKDSHVKQGPKIVEIDDHSHSSTDPSENFSQSSPANSSSPLDRLSNVTRQNTSSEKNYEVKTQSSESQADIQETSNSDIEVKEVLNDPKVMEILMDPQIIRLIQTLKDDPAKGQRIVDDANSDLKSKIRFLVTKGLLQFQTD